ncbi:hypothetical protein V6N13_095547 [Hibiscus sabdariffa]
MRLASGGGNYYSIGYRLVYYCVWQQLSGQCPFSLRIRLVGGFGVMADFRLRRHTRYEQGGFAKSGADWNLVFAAVLWNLWRYRNDRVFNNHAAEWGSIITRSRWLAEVTATAASTVRILHGSLSGPNDWTPPAEGWLKLNADGARSLVNGSASCGGVLRDHRDSSEALQMVQQHASGSDPYIIVSYIREVARSNNSVADWLAKFASDINFDVIFFESPPDGLVFG